MQFVAAVNHCAADVIDRCAISAMVEKEAGAFESKLGEVTFDGLTERDDRCNVRLGATRKGRDEKR